MTTYFSNNLSTDLVSKGCTCIFGFTLSFTINMFNKSFLSENRGEANTSQVFVPSIDLKLMMFC